MTTEDKMLLIEDLCCRLPFGVKCYIPEINDYRVLGSIQYDGINTLFDFWNKEQTRYELQLYISEFKPCIFPISSMTEEQKKEISKRYNLHTSYGLCIEITNHIEGYWDTDNSCHLQDYLWLINWLIKNNFDYKRLIPMGIAIDATGLGIY